MRVLKTIVKKTIKMNTGYQLTRFQGDGLLFMKEHVSEGTIHGVYGILQGLALKKILKDYRINVVLDVGAFYGQFARELRSIGYKDKIISFEPVSDVFHVLRNAAQDDPNWIIHNLALGRQNEERKINVAPCSAFSSFLKASSWCDERFGQIAIGSREETVVVRRLGDVINDTLSDLREPRIFLKMDTQGYDIEVFSGLDQWRGSVCALQTEVSVVPIYNGMPHMTQAIAFFEEAGFELAGMYPVTHDEKTARVIEFDCIMVNAGSVSTSP